MPEKRGTVVVDLAITPGGRPGDASPLGKGKRKLSDYEREVAHALMRKGHDKRSAIRMARGIINKAAATGRWGRGKVKNPAVRAGAVASIAQRKAFSAAHNMSNETPRGRRPFADEVETDLSWREFLHPRGHGGEFVNAGHPERSSGRQVKVAKISLPAGAPAKKAPIQRVVIPDKWSTSNKPKSRQRKSTRAARRQKKRVDKAMVEQKRRQKRYTTELERQREQARKIIAANRLHLGAAQKPRTGKKYTQPDPRGWAISGSFSEVTREQLIEIDLAYAAALDQNIASAFDLSWTEGLHPRDWHGRFIKAGGLRGPLDHNGRVVATRSETYAYDKHVRHADHAIIDNASRLSTDNDGVNGKTIVHADGSRSVEWSKDRVKLHRQVVDAVYRKQARTAKSDKKALFLGGLPGAGKSTSIKRIPGLNEKDYVTVNPDIFKEELAKRELVPELKGLSPLERSAFVHEESSTMALMLAEKARRNDKNIIWDITMNKASSVDSRLKPLRESGYSAHSVFVDIPFEMSQSRVEQRHRSGHLAYWRDTTGTHLGQRLVPSSHVATGKSTKGSSSANRDAFEAVKHKFDAFKLYDNSGENPKLLEERGQFRP